MNSTATSNLEDLSFQMRHVMYSKTYKTGSQRIEIILFCRLKT